MAIQGIHRAFEHLIATGLSKEKAEALLDTLADSRDALATKADLRELELRMTIERGATFYALAGLLIAMQYFLP